jgi:hypothetical protein
MGETVSNGAQSSSASELAEMHHKIDEYEAMIVDLSAEVMALQRTSSRTYELAPFKATLVGIDAEQGSNDARPLLIDGQCPSVSVHCHLYSDLDMFNSSYVSICELFARWAHIDFGKLTILPQLQPSSFAPIFRYETIRKAIEPVYGYGNFKFYEWAFLRFQVAFVRCENLIIV